MTNGKYCIVIIYRACHINDYDFFTHTKLMGKLTCGYSWAMFLKETLTLGLKFAICIQKKESAISCIFMKVHSKAENSLPNNFRSAKQWRQFLGHHLKKRTLLIWHSGWKSFISAIITNKIFFLKRLNTKFQVNKDLDKNVRIEYRQSQSGRTVDQPKLI